MASFFTWWHPYRTIPQIIVALTKAITTGGTSTNHATFGFVPTNRKGKSNRNRLENRRKKSFSPALFASTLV
jgi:hypothetical protein